MTRRDYDLLTEVLHKYYFLHDEPVRYTVESIADSLGFRLHQDNPNFDREQFIQNVKGE